MLSFAVRGGDPDVGTEGDLQASAEAVAVNRGDHRNRNPGPGGRNPLEEVGTERIPLPGVFGEALRLPAGEPADVDPGAEARAFAVEDDRAQAGLRRQPLGGRRDLLRTLAVEGVVFVATDQGNLGDVVFDGDSNAVFGHAPSLPGDLRGARRGTRRSVQLELVLADPDLVAGFEARHA